MSDWTVDRLNAAIAAERTSCADIVAGALTRAKDPGGEGKYTFRALREDARANGAMHDGNRTARAAVSPLAGLPISIKDNIDVAGEPTRGGSKLLEHAPPAASDAGVVKRLKSAGAVIIGRTNMSDLA